MESCLRAVGLASALERLNACDDPWTCGGSDDGGASDRPLTEGEEGADQWEPRELLTFH